jgi:hypothetical protein
MYSGKIAVPPGGGGIVSNKEYITKNSKIYRLIFCLFPLMFEIVDAPTLYSLAKFLPVWPLSIFFNISLFCLRVNVTWFRFGAIVKTEYFPMQSAT